MKLKINSKLLLLLLFGFLITIGLLYSKLNPKPKNNTEQIQEPAMPKFESMKETAEKIIKYNPDLEEKIKFQKIIGVSVFENTITNGISYVIMTIAEPVLEDSGRTYLITDKYIKTVYENLNNDCIFGGAFGSSVGTVGISVICIENDEENYEIRLFDLADGEKISIIDEQKIGESLGIPDLVVDGNLSAYFGTQEEEVPSEFITQLKTPNGIVNLYIDAKTGNIVKTTEIVEKASEDATDPEN